MSDPTEPATVSAVMCTDIWICDFHTLLLYNCAVRKNWEWQGHWHEIHKRYKTLISVHSWYKISTQRTRISSYRSFKQYTRLWINCRKPCFDILQNMCTSHTNSLAPEQINYMVQKAFQLLWITLITYVTLITFQSTHFIYFQVDLHQYLWIPLVNLKTCHLNLKIPYDQGCSFKP